jgi:DNA-binding response OmpR family regulator
MPVTRVLLVDDDEVICSTLSVALTESGFEVTSHTLLCKRSGISPVSNMMSY